MNKNMYNSKNTFCFLAGLFCHHVIAVFDHLRLDKIPERYILQRYSKNAVTDPNFNRRDHRATDADGTSIEYRRTILYNEAMKTVSKGCSSHEMFELALASLRGVNSRMDSDGLVTNSSSPASATEENHQGSSPSDEFPEPTHEFPEAESTNPYADIQPPLVARTKGCGKKKEEKGKVSASAAVTAKKARP